MMLKNATNFQVMCRDLNGLLGGTHCKLLFFSFSVCLFFNASLSFMFVSYILWAHQEECLNAQGVIELQLFFFSLSCRCQFELKNRLIKGMLKGHTHMLKKPLCSGVSDWQVSE